MKNNSLWTNLEHAMLVQLVADGKTNLEISAIIDRTRCAIGARVQEYRLRTGNPVEPRNAPIAKTVLVDRHDVPDWYVLGWRFAGFYVEQCKMEWASTKPERRPRVVRAMEAA